MEDTKTATTLDLRGLLCPLPVVKISLAVKQIEIGETIQATATDAGVLADIPAWARSSGNELVSMEKMGPKEFRFIVKRLK